MDSNARLSASSLRLIKTLSKESGLQPLVDLGYEMLGNPFTLTDFSVKLLASTGETQVTDDPVWNELQVNNNFVFQTFNYYNKNNLFSEIAKNDGPFFWLDPYCKYQRLIGKIYIDNKAVATLVSCAHNREFQECDKEMVTLLCDVFSIELQKKQHLYFSQGQLHQSFLQDLLEDSFTAEKNIADRLKVLNIRMKSKLLIISLDFQNLGISESTLPYLRDRVEQQLQSAKAIIYHQNIVILASFDNERHFHEIETKDLKEFLTANKLLAASSRSFTSLREVRAYYLESVEALKLGKLLHQEANFFRYENYLVYDLISNYPHHESRQKMVHPALRKLIQYDRDNNTEYFRSFYTYLLTFKNIKDAAELIKVHRNTMFHRIEKIESILNVDLNNGDILFQLYLSYKILEFNEALNPI